MAAPNLGAGAALGGHRSGMGAAAAAQCRAQHWGQEVAVPGQEGAAECFT